MWPLTQQAFLLIFTLEPVTNMSVSFLILFLLTDLHISSIGVANCNRISHDNPIAMLRRGKAPPIDSFTGEDITLTFDDWLLTLE